MRQTTSKFSRFPRHAFTLVELLVVVLLIVLVMTFTIPVLSRIGGTNTAKAYYDIAGLLEGSRTYAIANNTYVFVGFSEKSADGAEADAPQKGFGRIYAAAMAPKDGTRGYDPYDSSIGTKWETQYGKTKGLDYVAVSKLTTFNNLHMCDIILPSATTGPMRERPVYNYKQIGIDVSQTPFNWPLGTALKTEGAAGQIYFDHVVMFDPAGIVFVQSSSGSYKVDQYVELCLQQIRGSTPPATVTNAAVGNHAAISINGLTGAVRVFRP